MVESGGRVCQITNVSPGASSEQIKALFGHLGVVEEIELYPKIQDPANPITRMAYVKFEEPSSVDVAQHLTNTVFVDRALICVPFDGDTIPEESVAMQLPANVPPHAIQPSVVPAVDPAKLDEIQRTVYVGNLESKTVTAEKLMNFFAPCGDVRYVRLAGDETQPTRFAFVEFATTDHVNQAILMNGMLFCERPIKINHSNNAIVKPPGKADAREIDEAMRRVREAQSLIAKALEPEKGKSAKSRRSRSRSRSRHRRHRSRSRDRSRHRSRRSHSRSRSSRRRTRSRSRDRRSRRRSRSRERSSRRSRRSRSKSRSRRTRSRSKSRSKKSRSPAKKSSSSRSDRKSDRKKDDRKRDRERSKKSKHSSKSSDDEKKSSSKKEHKREKDARSSSDDNERPPEKIKKVEETKSNGDNNGHQSEDEKSATATAAE